MPEGHLVQLGIGRSAESTRIQTLLAEGHTHEALELARQHEMDLPVVLVGLKADFGDPEIRQDWARGHLPTRRIPRRELRWFRSPRLSSPLDEVTFGYRHLVYWLPHLRTPTAACFGEQTRTVQRWLHPDQVDEMLAAVASDTTSDACLWYVVRRLLRLKTGLSHVLGLVHRVRNPLLRDFILADDEDLEVSSWLGRLFLGRNQARRGQRGAAYSSLQRSHTDVQAETRPERLCECLMSLTVLHSIGQKTELEARLVQARELARGFEHPEDAEVATSWLAGTLAACGQVESALALVDMLHSPHEGVRNPLRSMTLAEVGVWLAQLEPRTALQRVSDRRLPAAERSRVVATAIRKILETEGVPSASDVLEASRSVFNFPGVVARVACDMVRLGHLARRGSSADAALRYPGTAATVAVRPGPGGPKGGQAFADSPDFSDVGCR